MERLKVGKHDRKIIIQHPVETKSATGQVVIVWETWATLLANKNVDKSGIDKEGYQENKAASTQVTIWSIHYIKKVDAPTVPSPKMRVIETATNQMYDVRQVREIGRRRGWELKTEYKY